MPDKSTPKSSPAPNDVSITWHSLHAEEVLQKLGTGLQNGLSQKEAAARSLKFGPNALVEAPRPGIFHLILDQLKGFVVILLIAAALISLFLREWVDAIAILTIILLNAILGVVQESRAEKALAALKKLSAPEASVMRDGHRVSVSARDLVPGDIVFIEAGNFVPADIRLLETANLKIEEAALTGESQAVQKISTVLLDRDIPLGDRKNTAFMGTLVNYGRGSGVVVSTGMHTQLGLVATMLQSVKEESTPLQKRLDQVGKTLGLGALIICGLVFVGEIIQGTDLTILTSAGGGLLPYLSASKELLVNMFMIAVSLAIAAVPEGLPAVVTISLALGMREMIKRHALIRKLSSVETLGSATVICSDKTGTLTQNEMTVTRLWTDGGFVEVTGKGYKPVGEFLVDGKKADLDRLKAFEIALWLGTLNNDARLEELPAENGEKSYRIVGDPTEAAIVVAAAKAGDTVASLNKSFPRKDEIPFDSERKRMSTIHQVLQPLVSDLSPFKNAPAQEQYVVAVKGAPDILLELCTQVVDSSGSSTRDLTGKERQRILSANDSMTQDALRVIGVAYRILDHCPQQVESKSLEKDLIFVGLIGMIDPAREEARPALQTARAAGIRTIMITGDYPNTARAVAESIGLLQKGHQVLTGAELNEIDDTALREVVKNTDVFARVSPEHKMRIVDALKANGEIVAMTGDGVNDAPAIKRADIGVAMGVTGTDVAKETADMVLTDDNYASIVSAIEQGRVIYGNIRKFVYYLVSCNLSEILTIFLPVAIGRWIFAGAAQGVLVPLTAIQLLWLNLITDGAPALALGAEKGEPDIMRQKPRPSKEPIINRAMWINVIIQTIALTAVTLIAFGLGLRHTQPEYAETLAFITLSLAQILRAYSSRSERFSIFKIGVFSNRYMNLAALSSIALLLVVIYTPLNKVFNTLPMGWAEWQLILPLVLIPTIIGELSKLIFKK